MWLLFSTSIAPVRLRLIEPAPVPAIPAPPGFAPPPSNVTSFEESTRIPTPTDWIVVWAPSTAAKKWCAPRLMFFNTIPVEELVPLPPTVRFQITNDFVRLVPSMETATPSILLIDQGPMTNGLPTEPSPPNTQLQLTKSESCWMRMGS